MSGAPSGVGAALAQPSHQHVAGSGGNGQQRVIASLAGVAVVARPLLGQTVCLADGGVQVDGQRPVAGSGPSRPGPGQQLPADPIQLADVAPPETAQKGPQLPSRLDGALTTQPMALAVPPVRSTSASSMQSPPARATSVITLSPVLARPGARPVQVPVNQFGQVPRPSGWRLDSLQPILALACDNSSSRSPERGDR